MTMAEADLYEPVKRFLEAQGYTVKGEIKDCDIVAVRGEEPPVVVELKISFSLPLVFQGIERKAITDDVYLAVAVASGGGAGHGLWARHHRDILKLCRLLGLGLLAVRGGRVEPHLDPLPYRPRPDRKRRGLLLKEFARRVGDPNRGGITRRPIVTAYRQDALRCASLLRDHGPLKPSRLRDLGGVVQAAAILHRNVYGWFERVERGLYRIAPTGLAALELYGDALADLAIPESTEPIPVR